MSEHLIKMAIFLSDNIVVFVETYLALEFWISQAYVALN